jgi:hypothetical protein
MAPINLTFFSPIDNAPAGSGPVSLRDAANYDFSKLFAKCSSIRIVINDGAGMGNQSAAITLLKRLRDLKYKGSIELVYIDDDSGLMAIRLRCLLPAESTITPVKRITRGEVFPLSYLPLCITVAAENVNFVTPEVWNSNVFVNLKLNAFDYEYNLPSQFTVLGGNDQALSDGVLFCNDDRTLVALQESDYPQFGEDRAFIQTLQQKSAAGEVLFQSVYGLYAEYSFRGKFKPTRFCNPSTELSYLLNALIVVQKQVAKPIVVLIHSPLPNLALKEIQELVSASKIKFAGFGAALDIDGKKITLDNVKAEDLTDLKADEILICYTGWLTQNLFNKLLQTSNFPPVVEGANATCYLDTRGIIHFHGGSDACTRITEIPHPDYALHRNASKVLEGHSLSGQPLEKIPIALDSSHLSEEVSCLVEFILKAQSGALCHYFQARRDAFHMQEDIVANALVKLMDVDFSKNELTLIPVYIKIITEKFAVQDNPDNPQIPKSHILRLLQIFLDNKDAVTPEDIGKFKALCQHIIDVLQEAFARANSSTGESIVQCSLVDPLQWRRINIASMTEVLTKLTELEGEVNTQREIPDLMPRVNN